MPQTTARKPLTLRDDHLARPLRKGMKVSATSKQTKKMNTQTFESTYALIVRSEEKERSVTESVVYLLLVLSTVFSIWQAVHQRVTVPNNYGAPSFAQTAEVQPRSV